LNSLNEQIKNFWWKKHIFTNQKIKLE
jgi:hypothetical protein